MSIDQVIKRLADEGHTHAVYNGNPEPLNRILAIVKSNNNNNNKGE